MIAVIHARNGLDEVLAVEAGRVATYCCILEMGMACWLEGEICFSSHL